MHATDPARTPETTRELAAPTELELCAQFIAEHGDYDDWSAETVDQYRNTIHHAASFGSA